MSQHLVFAYGTLMRGESNSSLLRSATFLGDGTTDRAVFGMVDIMGMYPAAYLVRGGFGGNRATGELYSVDLQTLQTLDHLEGHPNFYRRHLERVLVPGKHWAWIYLLPHNEVTRSHRIVPGLNWRKRSVD